MQLSSVRIQGMHNVKDKTYDLNNFNYLHGMNGAGKTTIMQAIQLSLLGYIPGTDKGKTAIFKHAGEPEMRVTLRISRSDDTDIQIIRGWSKTSKDIISMVDIQPDNLCVENISDLMQGLELPVFNFNEFVGMTSNKLKDWFMWFLPAADSDFVWETVLRDAIKEYGKILDPEFVTEIVDYTKDLPTGLEGIRKLNEYLKSVQSFKKSESSRVQSTIQSLVFYDDCEEGLDSSKFQAEIAENVIQRDKLNKDRLLARQNRQIRSEIDGLKLSANSLLEDSAYNDMSERFKELSAKVFESPEFESPDTVELEVTIEGLIGQLSSKGNEITRRRVLIEERQKVLKGQGICPYTQGKCAEISKLVEQYKQDVIQYEEEIDNLTTESADINNQITSIKEEINKIQYEFDVERRKIQQDFDKERRDHEKELANVNQVIRTLESAYARLQSLTSKIVDGVEDRDDSYFAIEIDKLLESSNDKQALITKIAANKKYNELTETLTKQKYQVEQNIEILKDWIRLTDVNGLQSRVMDKPFEHLATDMTMYLQQLLNDKNIKARFYLSEKVNSFSFGIDTNDMSIGYRPFDLLSTGEQCMYTLSLLLSIVKSGGVDMPLILADDILDHLDKNNIKNLFKTLYEIEDIQILLAGVQGCAHPNAKDFVIEVK